jgi:hypothetical protein
VSHSCDLASSEEDRVELIVGREVSEVQATHQNGQSVRYLNLKSELPGGGVDFALFQMKDRKLIAKEDLDRSTPWDRVSYATQQRGLLRRWMAQRYARSEFPDAFVTWLKDSRVLARLEKLAKQNSAALVGIYFDLEDDSERTNPDDPYSLGITVVYTADDEGAKEAARQVAEQISAEFDRRCRVGDRWQWIELLNCEPASDLEFPLAASCEFRRWRLEHRSVCGEPLPEEG